VDTKPCNSGSCPAWKTGEWTKVSFDYDDDSDGDNEGGVDDDDYGGGNYDDD